MAAVPFKGRLANLVPMFRAEAQECQESLAAQMRLIAQDNCPVC